MASGPVLVMKKVPAVYGGNLFYGFMQSHFVGFDTILSDLL